MRLRVEKRSHRRRCKPFLVLPMVVNDSLEKSQGEVISMPAKNTGLKLFTKTWPPKRDNKNKNSEELSRPLTATLDKPTILDIRLIGEIDMSKVRKEFLNISNLCKMPLLLKTRKTVKINRPLSLPPAEKPSSKKKKVVDTDDSWEDEDSVRSARKVKNNKLNNKIKQTEAVITAVKKTSAVRSSSSDANNNNKTFKAARKHVVASGKLLSVKNELMKSTKLPEPCKTCGRPDQPERFHSHPATPLRATKRMEEPPKIPVKSTVQKPIAMKYKSKTTAEKKAPIRKPAPPPPKATRISPTTARVTATSPASDSQTKKETRLGSDSKTAVTPPSRVRSAKRTLTCYLCGREFGTASLSLHEPNCLEKWERENANLPLHLQRKPPPKPDPSATKEEWDKLAWESSQSTLTPCQNCGRTFYPDRLLVHQRSCKTPQHNAKASSTDPHAANNLAPMSQSTPNTPSGRRPPSVECYICGKMFGSNSIKIHERQCLKKWNMENDALPADMRSPPPSRNTDKSFRTPEPAQRRASTESEKEPDKEDRPKSSKKPPLFPCYICGKLFTVNSIYIHEPQCLKMWKIENEKLPPHKRRPQPLKPDIKFTRDGKIDFQATNEANWQSHLSQLVPCKLCARTFNPDRVEVHERSCKGC